MNAVQLVSWSMVDQEIVGQHSTAQHSTEWQIAAQDAA